MTLDFTQYAKYGMDRFGFTIQVNPAADPAASIRIDTNPVVDQQTIDALTEIFPEAIESVNQKVSGFMMHDGSVRFNGVNPSYRMRAATILREGRDNYIRLLEKMEDDSLRKAVAQYYANEAIHGRIDLATMELVPVCCAHGNLGELLQAITDAADLKDLTSRINRTLSIPASDSRLPADFRAEYDERIVARFPLLLVMAIDKLRVHTEHEISRMREGLDKANAYCDPIARLHKPRS